MSLSYIKEHSIVNSVVILFLLSLFFINYSLKHSEPICVLKLLLSIVHQIAPI